MSSGASITAYSFLDVIASISGPGGSFDLGGGNAEEGIAVTRANSKNVMTAGADGSVMHSLRAEDSGTATVTVLKTSPLNAMLANLYNAQKDSSATWGRNTISIRDMANGDDVTLSGCAFQTHPDINYATEGGTNAWVFDVGRISQKPGTSGKGRG
jgi:hypothetical protein